MGFETGFEIGLEVLLSVSLVIAAFGNFTMAAFFFFFLKDFVREEWSRMPRSDTMKFFK